MWSKDLFARLSCFSHRFDVDLWTSFYNKRQFESSYWYTYVSHANKSNNGDEWRTDSCSVSTSLRLSSLFRSRHWSREKSQFIIIVIFLFLLLKYDDQKRILKPIHFSSTRFWSFIERKYPSEATMRTHSFFFFFGACVFLLFLKLRFMFFFTSLCVYSS